MVPDEKSERDLVAEDDQSKAVQGNRRAGLRPDERDPDDPHREPAGSAGGATNFGGAGGGGLAAGGLAGTNIGDGASGNADLDEAAGVGIADQVPEEPDEHGPFASRSGAAVGGTPAGKRASGGQSHGVSPGNDTGADSTIGIDPKRRPR